MPIRLISVVILIVVGLGAPVGYVCRVLRASRNGAEELRALKPVRDMAAKELPDDPDLRRTGDGRISMRVSSRGARSSSLETSSADTEARLRDRLEKDTERIDQRVQELWKRTLRYWMYSKCCCCCCSSEVDPEFKQRKTEKLERKLALSWRSEQISSDVEACFVESMKLQTFSSLTESYKPSQYYCYWEAVDMLRKFFLVGAESFFPLHFSR
jgi:hypothetical protein